MVLSGEGIGRFAGRKVNELFRDIRGDASEYDDRECLCLLSSELAFVTALISRGTGLMGSSECSSAAIGKKVVGRRSARNLCWFSMGKSFSDSCPRKKGSKRKFLGLRGWIAQVSGAWRNRCLGCSEFGWEAYLGRESAGICSNSRAQRYVVYLRAGDAVTKLRLGLQACLQVSE